MQLLAASLGAHDAVRVLERKKAEMRLLQVRFEEESRTATSAGIGVRRSNGVALDSRTTYGCSLPTGSTTSTPHIQSSATTA